MYAGGELGAAVEGGEDAGLKPGATFEDGDAGLKPGATFEDGDAGLKPGATGDRYVLSCMQSGVSAGVYAVRGL